MKKQRGFIARLYSHVLKFLRNEWFNYSWIVMATITCAYNNVSTTCPPLSLSLYTHKNTDQEIKIHMPCLQRTKAKIVKQTPPNTARNRNNHTSITYLYFIYFSMVFHSVSVNITCITTTSLHKPCTDYDKTPYKIWRPTSSKSLFGQAANQRN